MVDKIAEGIVEAFPEKQYAKVWKLIKSLSPTISFDPFDGKPKIGFDLKRLEESENMLKSLLKLLDESHRQQNDQGIWVEYASRYPKRNFGFTG
jgi:hypothetical protein